MTFVELVDVESYRMRSSASYPGDRVERRVWLIGGKRFEFARIVWGDGSVTVRAYADDSVVPFREIGCGGWQTDPVYLGESGPGWSACACGCDALEECTFGELW